MDFVVIVSIFVTICIGGVGVYLYRKYKLNPDESTPPEPKSTTTPPKSTTVPGTSNEPASTSPTTTGPSNSKAGTTTTPQPVDCQVSEWGAWVDDC